MANTFDAALVCNLCCDVAVSTLGQCLAPLDCLWSECSPDVLAPLRPVVIPMATATSGILTNPTNFATGDTTLTQVTVTVEHLVEGFGLTDAEWQSGYRLTRLIQAHMESFAAGVFGKVTALITAANFSKVDVTSVANWKPSTLKAILGQLPCADRYCLWLNPDLYYSIAYSDTGGCCFILTPDKGPGALGFQSIWPVNVWTGATAGTMGFAFIPRAIVMVAGLPASAVPCSSVYGEERNITVPVLGIPAKVVVWCDPNTRAVRATIETMFGVKPADNQAAVRIVPGP